jgi:hypothetical protein
VGAGGRAAVKVWSLFSANFYRSGHMTNELGLLLIPAGFILILLSVAVLFLTI